MACRGLRRASATAAAHRGGDACVGSQISGDHEGEGGNRQGREQMALSARERHSSEQVRQRLLAAKLPGSGILRSHVDLVLVRLGEKALKEDSKLREEWKGLQSRRVMAHGDGDRPERLRTVRGTRLGARGRGGRSGAGAFAQPLTSMG